MERRFVLLDDHEILRHGLKVLLERDPLWKVVGEAADGTVGVGLVRELNPDCVVADMAMPGLNGAAAVTAIREYGYKGGIVVLSGYGWPSVVKAVRDAGANAYVLKERAIEQIRGTIETVLAGGADFSSEALGASESEVQPMQAARGLTKRELEVLRGLVEGRSVKVIAFQLGLSPKTVDVHRSKLMLKMRVGNLAELTRLAIREGLLPP
jgi:DNA-binding NarL/FixJ family response regulator